MNTARDDEKKQRRLSTKTCKLTDNGEGESES